jgi:hypothetical protein
MTRISNSVEYENAITRLKQILEHSTLLPETELELTELVKSIQEYEKSLVEMELTELVKSFQEYEKSLVEILDEIDDTRHMEGC